MSDVWVESRLAEGRSRREWLEEESRGIAEENARIRRHLDAVRAAEASTAAAARGTRDRFEDALEDLGTRLAIARHRLAAELTDNRDLFERAVEAELHDWDTYVERVQKGGRAGWQRRRAVPARNRRAHVAPSRGREASSGDAKRAQRGLAGVGGAGRGGTR
jgi:hypothetical protein